MASVTLTRSQYESLVGMALSAYPDEARALRSSIDDANKIKRYLLLVRFMDVGGSPPSPGSSWPLAESGRIELDRPISREDVDLWLSTRANNPIEVLVTSDENGLVGWTQLDEYDFVANAQ